jgi:hypothetical protein
MEVSTLSKLFGGWIPSVKHNQINANDIGNGSRTRVLSVDEMELNHSRNYVGVQDEKFGRYNTGERLE